MVQGSGQNFEMETGTKGTYLIACTPLPSIPTASPNVLKHSEAFLWSFGDPRIVLEGSVGV
jgi:hypothetical protein